MGSARELAGKSSNQSLDEGEVSILYLGYSGVVVRTKSHAFAFDPADLVSGDAIAQLGKLDAVFYGHGHGDHFSKEHAALLSSKTGAYVAAEESLVPSLKSAIPSERLVPAKPGERKELKGFSVTPIAGIHRGPIVLFIVEAGGISIFHGGDSAYVPLGSFRADLALVPTGSPSPTASPRDAFRMVSDLKPKVAAAFHGSASQHREFLSLVKENLSQVNAFPLEEGRTVKVSVK
ncbi:MAG: MBL fold metallo-hydrolase [Thermoproteota archaeon]